MTIKDIARLSGCGVATVSRVLNQHPDVSEETRRKVLAVVEEYGFQPNNNAKHLKQQAGTGITILVKGTQNMLFADLVERVQTLLHENGREAAVYYLDEDADEVGYALRLCRERKPMGILFLGGDVETFGVEFHGISVPCVLLTNTAKELGFENLSSLTTDDGEAAAQVIRFLAERGHRRIGVLGGNWACSQISWRRLKGCEETCARLGLPFEQDRQCEPCRYSMGEAYAATLRLLDRCPDLTAIFAMSDVMAMGTIRALRDLGKQVPEDISVVGFDGISMARYSVPRLATVRQDTQLLAERGVDILLRNIERKNHPVHEVVPFQLIPGESVARLDQGPSDFDFIIEKGDTNVRRAGILMPISALPSPYGIGTMGAAAREFADFLAAAGQSCWQILPVGPTSFGDSPYQSFSSYAGNPYFIDLEDLAAEGLLEAAEFRDLNWGDDPGRVDYGLLYETRYPVLRRACGRLLESSPADLARFREEHRDWLEDYALFMALKEKYGGVSWFQWPEGERLRRPEALAAAREELAEETAFWQAVQYLFFRQWKALKAYANGKGVSVIGDLPIYVSGDSADVWANPDQFQLDGEGRPTEVAGCPPDGFSADGQLWGNPLFDWERMEADGYQWWLRRIAFQFRIYDTLRIDHFRGFDAYYAIPYGEATAKNGRWRPGPGIRFFEAVERALGPRDIIAEDLGFLTDSVRKLLEETGYPGMKVLEFAFDSRDTGSGYLPHCYTPHCVAYTGTHDNDTVRGWMASAPAEDAALARAYLRLNEQEGFHWGMMRSVWASAADLAVIQFQDLLGLGGEARMNIPSTLGGNNWRWRTLPGSFGGALARQLRREMEIYQRLPAQS